MEELVHRMLAGRKSMQAEEVPVATDEEYVRMMYLASYGLDRHSSFRFTAADEQIRKGAFGYPGGQIEQKP